MVKISFAFRLRYLTSAVTRPRRRIRLHYRDARQMSEFESGWLKEVNNRLTWVEVMRQLDEAGKSGSATAVISVRMALVDQRPQQSPCLSPIEHIWDLMGRLLEPSLNISDLAQQLETIWFRNSVGRHRDLYQAMEVDCLHPGQK
ncbi:hypothetical protein TNCV_3541551 [Trichonephila clavipes]|nr:hypothetical protein TNCV_3541551 [Trichonephila clavipes]